LPLARFNPYIIGPTKPGSNALNPAQSCVTCQLYHNMMMAVWRSGNVVGRFNEVTLRQARLVLGWVTVFGWVNHLCISAIQANSTPSGTGNEYQSAAMLCGWGVKAGMVHSTCG